MNKQFSNVTEVLVRVTTTSPARRAGSSPKVCTTDVVKVLEAPRDLSERDVLNIAAGRFAKWSADVMAVKATGAGFGWSSTASTTLSIYADGVHVWNTARAAELGQMMGVLRAFNVNLKSDANKVRVNVIGGLAVWEATTSED